MAVVSCLLLCIPYIVRFGSISAYVRMHVRGKKGKFLHIGVFFRFAVWYTRLNKLNFENRMIQHINITNNRIRASCPVSHRFFT